MEVKLTFLEAGHCTHPAKTILPGRGWESLRFPASVALIEHPTQGPILYDTGYTERFFEITRRFPEKFYALATPVTLDPEHTAKRQLEKRGIPAHEIRTVICSHFHADHVGGLGDFPQAQYIYDRSGYLVLKDLSRFQGVRRGFLQGLIPDDFEERSLPLDQFKNEAPARSELKDFIPGTDLFGDGSVIAVPLPGHMEGHIGLWLNVVGGKKYFLVSDACWVSEAFEEKILPHWIARMVMSDSRKYKETIEKIHALSISHPETRIVPCHCERALERERVNP